MHTPNARYGKNGTLVGQGFLREAAMNRLPEAWQGAAHRGRSAMRNCMFLPAWGPSDIARIRNAPVAPPRRPHSTPRPVTARRDLARPAAGGLLPSAVAPAAVEASRPAVIPPPPRAAARASEWWEEPLALGSLLVLLPPAGLAAVWASPRYSREARWALTAITALTMTILGAVALVALAR